MRYFLLGILLTFTVRYGYIYFVTIKLMNCIASNVPVGICGRAYFDIIDLIDQDASCRATRGTPAEQWMCQ